MQAECSFHTLTVSMRDALLFRTFPTAKLTGLQISCFEGNGRTPFGPASATMRRVSYWYWNSA